MRALKIILGVVGALILLVIIIAIVVPSDEDETPNGTTPKPTATPTPAPLVISVEEIYQAYQENEARANANYKKIKLNLHFKVDEVEDKYVIQELDGFLDQAQLRFDQDELVQFDIGDRTNRICELDGFDLDTWLKFDCR